MASSPLGSRGCHANGFWRCAINFGDVLVKWRGNIRKQKVTAAVACCSVCDPPHPLLGPFVLPPKERKSEKEKKKKKLGRPNPDFLVHSSLFPYLDTPHY